MGRAHFACLFLLLIISYQGRYNDIVTLSIVLQEQVIVLKTKFSR